MGVIICAEHGRSGIALVCQHLAVAVAGRVPLPRHFAVVAEIIKGDGAELTLCAGCFSEAGLSTTPNRLSLDDIERLAKMELDPRPVCVACLAAAEARDSRA